MPKLNLYYLRSTINLEPCCDNVKSNPRHPYKGIMPLKLILVYTKTFKEFIVSSITPNTFNTLQTSVSYSGYKDDNEDFELRELLPVTYMFLLFLSFFALLYISLYPMNFSFKVSSCLNFFSIDSLFSVKICYFISIVYLSIMLFFLSFYIFKNKNLN